MSELWFVLVGCIVAIHGAVRAAWSPCGQSMLASLTPIAERARGSSWRVTVTAFAIGALAAGALGGTVLGAVGLAAARVGVARACRSSRCCWRR